MEKFKSENYTNFGGINTKASKYLTGPTEFLDLSNLDFTTPGALTKRPGTALYNGATVLGRITGLYQFERLNGASYLVASANTNIYNVTTNFSSFRASLTNNALFDFKTFVDRLFCANGSQFFIYDGTSQRNFGIPVPPAITAFTGISHASGGMSGIYLYSYAFQNDRGDIGGIAPGFTVSVEGQTAIVLSGFTLITGFGVTATAIYRTAPGLQQFTRIGFLSGSTFIDNNLPLSNELSNNSLWFSLAPRYLEIYNNQLFMAGFSGLPSTVFFSEIGKPETIRPSNFFEVRTNDGDRVTGLKSYAGQLVVFKEKSFSVLSGDSPENFLLREVSTEYGCLSHRAIAVYEDFLTFLDRKGIAIYNGANVQIMSNAIEPTFNAMNPQAALNNATAVHNRSRNELWYSIPCDGATLNNCTVVFDYVSKAFTKFEGFNASSILVTRATFSTETAFYGSYSGAVVYFGPNLTSDLGLGFTCLAESRFLNDAGNSVTKQWRRFYLDVQSQGISSSVKADFRADYGSSIELTRTIGTLNQQTRTDFGIPAKSLQVSLTHIDPSSPLKMFGFSFEYRIQRMV